MIRVNLLPIKQARRRSAGRTQLAVFAMLIVAEFFVFGVFFLTTSSDLDKIKKKVNEHQQAVTQAQLEVKDAEELERDKDQLTQQLKILDELEKSRSGPVRLLDELQAMMSPPRNENDRFAQLKLNWNVEWDPRRLWLVSFTETNGEFLLSGGAANADDVAEFLQRLSTGKHFKKVELDIVTQKNVDQGKSVDFKIFGTIDYSGAAQAVVAPPAGKGS